MLRRIKRLAGQGEEGQSLVLLAFALIVVLGATAMSVDVGRAYWAKSQVQAAVDAAALAGAAGLPNTTTAGSQADLYWDLNNDFLQSQGSNVTLTKSYVLTDKKQINVVGSADIDTWFARVLGINTWHVSASASAEYSQVDAMLVLDRSGSMCDTTYITNGGASQFVGHVRLADGDVVASGNNPMPSTGTSTIIGVAKDSASSGKTLDQLLWVGQRFQWRGATGASGEWMQITNINNAQNRITVLRGVVDPNKSVDGSVPTGTASTKQSHTPSTTKWIDGETCRQAGLGPYHPWEYIKAGGTIFVNNMNSLYDQIGYVEFGSEASLSQDFTTSFTALKATIAGTNDPSIFNTATGLANNPNGDKDDHWTNIGHGITYGVNRHLTSPAKRNGVTKVIVLLSDGIPNKYCSESVSSVPCSPVQNETSATQRARDAATYAKDNGIIIYTISYGTAAPTSLMAEIAATTGGKHYIAPNEATLNTAFQEIAKSTHVKLTK